MTPVFDRSNSSVVSRIHSGCQIGTTRRGRCTGIGCLTISLVLLSLSQSTFAQTLRVVCAEIAPFCFVENGVNQGYVYEIGQEILRRLELQSRIEMQPLARSLQTIQKNSRVISLWVGRIPEREETVRWLTPVVTDDFHMFTLRGKAKADTIDEARRLRAIASTVAGANLVAAQNLSLFRIEATSSEESNVKKLLAGRVDGWIATKSTAEYSIARHGLDRSELVRGIKLADYTAYIAASTDIDERTANDWVQTFEAMRNDGYIGRIMQKYGVSEQ